MKYTTKQNRIEEITIDLEDGCILRLDRFNILKCSVRDTSENIKCGGVIYSHTPHLKVKVGLMNGVDYTFLTEDITLIENILDLIKP